MARKTLVLDANILIRAVLGTRVRGLLLRYATAVDFFAPEPCYEEARRHLPPLLARRGIPVAPPWRCGPASNRSCAP